MLFFVIEDTEGLLERAVRAALVSVVLCGVAMLKPSFLPLASLVCGLLLAAALPAARAADVDPAATLYITSYNGVSTFDAATGAPTNANFLPGVTDASGVVVAGNRLYVASGDGTVGEYATTGALVNTAFLSERNPHCMLVAGNTIYVSGDSTVDAFSASTGELLAGFTPAKFGLETLGLARLSNTLFVSTPPSGHVAEVDATTGTIFTSGGAVSGAAGGFTYFLGTSTAGNATLYTGTAPGGGVGAA